MSAPIPARRPRGIRTMEEMGMSMEGGGDMSGMKAAMERNAKAGSKPMNHGGMEGMKMHGADKKSSHELAEFKASSPMRIGHYYARWHRTMAGSLRKSTGVNMSAAVRDGTPFEEICHAAKTFGADLIVLTTHGYTGLKHVWLGSTAERVVRHAYCPVLAVRELKRKTRLCRMDKPLKT